MRIISGNFKRKKILEPKDQITRPLKDLTKESIFNIIYHSKKFDIQLKDSNILDLFSGVGSFGLECLSRGSSSLTFVENYKEVLMVLKKNISLLECDDKSTVIEKDIFNRLNFNDFKKKFEIIFLDPPFKEERLALLLNLISDSNILKDNGIIILHRHKNENDNFPENFKVIEQKIYGVSKIIFGNYS
ncbi:16S rRNA (guanine(966)-N(2))-methyltransferase RsmD [Candidatus Pelagibacter sp. Uisw_099_02]|uniref:16S rRNA (guanine(966)-N(2))-methyltransferase RsmD n=1 Tax=Candidatus Pelagibacter sp. Uisw_099_02 TaxID=3230981 RepID=UPI0039E87FE0|tara:strand:+ start:436 stop:999 length:564 start_codon:yes stop_codon:yes gene_type:complete